MDCETVIRTHANAEGSLLPTVLSLWQGWERGGGEVVGWGGGRGGQLERTQGEHANCAQKKMPPTLGIEPTTFFFCVFCLFFAECGLKHVRCEGLNGTRDGVSAIVSSLTVEEARTWTCSR